MESLLTYFWLPFIIILLGYFVFIGYKMISISLNKVVKNQDKPIAETIEPPPSKSDDEEYCTLRKSELQNILNKNALMEKLLIEALANYGREKTSLRSLINISAQESSKNIKSAFKIGQEFSDINETESISYKSLNN